MTLQLGQILDGKYRIVRGIGGGAMGKVYEGENLRIHRRVAIKVLLPSLSAQRDAVKRFEREAQAAGRIGSEHIVEVLDLGSLQDGGLYMVMEFLEGVTLGARMQASGILRPRDVAPWMQQLLTGLEAAHAAGIIHRDLKPENVFLCNEVAGQRDFVKILDFGVSKFNSIDGDLSMTTAGSVVGTPYYLAPERAKGATKIDARSDLYTVGVLLYEAVTGRKPFVAGTFNELVFKIVLEEPPPPENFVPDFDQNFGKVLRRAMARDPNERFQTAAEFREALSVWLQGGHPPAEVGRGTHGASAACTLDPSASGLVEEELGATRLVVEGSGAIAPPTNAAPTARPSGDPHPKRQKNTARSRFALALGAIGFLAIGMIAGWVVLRPTFPKRVETRTASDAVSAPLPLAVTTASATGRTDDADPAPPGAAASDVALGAVPLAASATPRNTPAPRTPNAGGGSPGVIRPATPARTTQSAGGRPINTELW